MACSGPIPWADELVELRLANCLGLTAEHRPAAMIVANAQTVTNIGNETGTRADDDHRAGRRGPGCAVVSSGNAKTGQRSDRYPDQCRR